MQVIITKYHGPGNSTGARISATSSNGARTYTPYDYSLDTINCHIIAAKNLVERLDWKQQEYAIGSLKKGYVFVPVIEKVKL